MTKNFRIICSIFVRKFPSNRYAEYLLANMIEFATIADAFSEISTNSKQFYLCGNLWHVSTCHSSVTCGIVKRNLHPSDSCGTVYLQLYLYSNSYLYLYLRQSICKYLYYLCSANIVGNQSDTNVICYVLSAYVADGYSSIGMYLRSRLVFRCKSFTVFC